MSAGDGLPLLVLVSGAPGSGKTTLADHLATALGLPRLNRDELWAGLRFTAARGGPDGVARRGIAAEYGALEHLLAVGVSLIADGTLYRGEMEAHVWRLCDLAEVVNLHCVTEDAAKRFRQRQLDRGLPEELVDQIVEQQAQRQDQFTPPLEIECQQIIVSTDDGFVPSVDQLVEALIN